MTWICARQWTTLTALSLVLFIGSQTPASAQEKPALDPAHGREVAQRVCVGCHAIEPGVETRQADVPSFPEIANRPDRTIQTIIGAMYYPHPEMPGIPLTSKEMRDVAAYILTYRKEQ